MLDFYIFSQNLGFIAYNAYVCEVYIEFIERNINSGFEV